MAFDYDNEEKNKLENMDPAVKAEAIKSLMARRDPAASAEDVAPIVDPIDVGVTLATGGLAAGPAFAKTFGMMGAAPLKKAGQVVAKEAGEEAAAFLAPKALSAAQQATQAAARQAEVSAGKSFPSIVQSLRDKATTLAQAIAEKDGIDVATASQHPDVIALTRKANDLLDMGARNRGRR